MNDTLSKHAIGDIVYKPVNKTGEHEYLLPLDGQALDTTKYKRLIDYLGFSTLPNLNGRYLRADTNPNALVDAGLPNIIGGFGVDDQTTSAPYGAFWVGDPFSYDATSSGTGNGRLVGFDASRSSAVYGKSDTVTPLTYTVRAYICYA